MKECPKMKRSELLDVVSSEALLACGVSFGALGSLAQKRADGALNSNSLALVLVYLFISSADLLHNVALSKDVINSMTSPTQPRGFHARH